MLFDATSVPEEFLTDTSYWMDAHEMESFLEAVSHIYGQRYDGNFLEQIGHAVPDLRSWGVLDSVLRMMPRPQEILSQPARFLSYFVTPQPPVENLHRRETCIEFDLPITSEQYPLTIEYLRASFESLPVFVGKPLASCSWHGIHLKLEWEVQQKSMFAEEDLGHQLSPDLLRSIVASLEKSQHELEQKNAELQSKNEQLLARQAELEARVDDAGILQAIALPREHLQVEDSAAQSLRQGFSRLSDYMVRAQQLITMLIGQDRMNSSIKAAMKRVDWERVKTQFPLTLQECREILDYQPRSTIKEESISVENQHH